ncbi:FluC/FEX family fluoride channel [Corynebacterium anserum]|nr:CrcB family protein [Corynebacterium anserum]MBC2682481.1 hypothetical protein [Corynebacterium anserum]
MGIANVGIALVMLVGGGAGATLRFLLDQYLQNVHGMSPLRAVNRINAIGTSVLALVIVLTAEVALTRGRGDAAYVCAFFLALTGGFTTFSTAMVNSVKDSSSLSEAFANQAMSVLVSLAGFFGTCALVWCGIELGALLTGR